MWRYAKLVMFEKIFLFSMNIVKRMFTKRVETINCGSEYGGFAIYDKNIKRKRKSIVFSFGVGEDISFDLDLIERYNCEVYAFDPTPKSINWVKKQNIDDRFHFFPYGISDRDGMEKFHLPKNPEYVSGSVLSSEALSESTIDVQMKRFSTIVSELQVGGYIDILKMDIEGSEFSVIPDILNSDIHINQICVEIHYRMKIKENSNKISKVLANSLLNKHLINIMKQMKKRNYVCINISNTYEEFTFLKVK